MAMANEKWGPKCVINWVGPPCTFVSEMGAPKMKNVQETVYAPVVSV